MQRDLVDADVLARFANLKPEETEEFRQSVAPDFVPDFWWTEDARSPDGTVLEGVKIWEAMQELLHATWASGFDTNDTLSVLLNYSSLELAPEMLLAPKTRSTSTFQAWLYQRAAMFLFNQSWRARTCNQCRNLFVAHEPADQYCSATCKTEFRRQYKAAHIRERRNQERQRKQIKRTRR